MSEPQGTAAAAKRSLSHFAAGRLLSALVGVATLLLLVRSLSREEYGLYIALFAAFEIIQLAASPGAYAIAFRYLPELRVAGAGRSLLSLVSLVSAYRFITLAIVSGVIALKAEWLAHLLGMPQHLSTVRLFSLVLVFEGMARFIDVEFESLLQQGLAQISVLARNGLKLVALLWVGGVGAREVPIDQWVGLEALTSGLGLVVSALLLARHLLQRATEVPLSNGAGAMGRQLRFAIPTYFSQVLYLAAGADMVKLLVSRLMGVSVTAAFGFAAALSSTIQKYLPSFLLIGWVRPLFISARSQGKPNDYLVDLSGTVIKLNMLMLAPIASVLIVVGETVVSLLSGGRMVDSLPYLLLFLLLLVFQSVRAVVSLLGMTLEVGSGSLVATVFSLIGIACGVALYPSFGVWSLCLGLLLSEGVWSAVMIVLLRKRDLHFRFPIAGILKFLASVLLASVAGWLLRTYLHQPGVFIDIVIGTVVALLCIAACAVLKPFAQVERELMNRLLPRRLFIW